jgi:hypothetical protein
MKITNQIYLGAEDAMSFALDGVSRPDGLMRLCIVFFAPLMLVLLLHGPH